jgi:hypothetical protein
MIAIIRALLEQIDAPGSFAVRLTANAGDLRLEVRGAGPVRLPVSRAAARRLVSVARPARHGFKTETRLDRGVRDTWEIPKSRVSIDRRRWNTTLGPALDEIGRRLGLPDGRRLTPELHNLLIYEPGQFFVSHQDTEKRAGMVATLVVILPSKASGGALVVRHHDEQVVFRGHEDKLTLAGFYADCAHEVRPVRSGYRVVLTYNLMLADGGEHVAAAPPEPADDLAAAVRRYFAEPLTARWVGDSPERPDRLVYLLDHQYTRRGLSWNRLKNADARRAAALRETARQLDCEIFLALADVHEVWNCEDEELRRGFYEHAYGGPWDDEEGGDDETAEEVGAGGRDDAGMPPLIDLIESAVGLRHWVGLRGDAEAAAAAAVVDAREVCYTKPSLDLKPFESHHEGYMGNWGNTVEHWYHRAAVVLWPRERTFVIRAKASAAWAIGEVAAVLQRGDLAEARRLVSDLRPFWAEAARREEARGFAARTLRVAADLDDANAALWLAEPLTAARLSATAAAPLLAMRQRYGLDWLRAVVDRWESEPRHLANGRRPTWLASVLPRLCARLCATDAASGMDVERMSAEELVPLSVATRRLIELAGPTLGVVESCATASALDVQEAIVRRLAAVDANASDPVGPAMHLLRAAHARYRRDALRRLGLAPVHAAAVGELARRLAAPPRARGDWSIPAALRCRCGLCAVLGEFLLAEARLRFEWPLAEQGRMHVHRAIDGLELPVRHVTRRSGRPYTLVLEKTAALFEREAAARAVWKRELAWLRRTERAF